MLEWQYVKIHFVFSCMSIYADSHPSMRKILERIMQKLSPQGGRFFIFFKIVIFQKAVMVFCPRQRQIRKLI